MHWLHYQLQLFLPMIVVAAPFVTGIAFGQAVTWLLLLTRRRCTSNVATAGAT